MPWISRTIVRYQANIDSLCTQNGSGRRRARHHISASQFQSDRFPKYHCHSDYLPRAPVIPSRGVSKYHQFFEISAITSLNSVIQERAARRAPVTCASTPKTCEHALLRASPSMALRASFLRSLTSLLERAIRIATFGRDLHIRQSRILIPKSHAQSPPSRSTKIPLTSDVSLAPEPEPEPPSPPPLACPPFSPASLAASLPFWNVPSGLRPSLET